MSVSLAPTTTTITATTSVGPSPTSSGIPLIYWILLIAVLLLIFIILLWYRRRGFTVTVQDARTRSPIQGASVLADGPESLSGVTENDGRVKFGKVKEGDYSIRANAPGYLSSVSVTIEVKKKTEYTVLLDRIAPFETEGVGGVPHGVPTPTAPSVTQPEPAIAPTKQEEPEDIEGFGGPRIREIIRTFQTKGAISPETALTAEELGLSRLFVRIMKRRRGKTTIFMEINGRYYLNQKALQE
jgi:hypothetical protein